jgi:putative flippase GtrA
MNDRTSTTQSSAPAAPGTLGARFTRFAMVGAVGTAAHYLTLIALVEVAGTGGVIATTAGFIVGLVVNYVLNRRYTFASRRPHRSAFWRFALVAVCGMVMNGAIFAFATGSLQMHYLLSQVLATVIVLGWNFIANAFWTFGGRDAG